MSTVILKRLLGIAETPSQAAALLNRCGFHMERSIRLAMIGSEQGPDGKTSRREDMLGYLYALAPGLVIVTDAHENPIGFCGVPANDPSRAIRTSGIGKLPIFEFVPANADTEPRIMVVDQDGHDFRTFAVDQSRATKLFDFLREALREAVIRPEGIQFLPEATELAANGGVEGWNLYGTIAVLAGFRGTDAGDEFMVTAACIAHDVESALPPTQAGPVSVRTIDGFWDVKERTFSVLIPERPLRIQEAMGFIVAGENPLSSLVGCSISRIPALTRLAGPEIMVVTEKAGAMVGSALWPSYQAVISNLAESLAC